MAAASDWIEFWDTKHSIYVNARHEAAHFRRIAEDIRAYAPERGVMLDYGCGEALGAERVAEPVSRLILCEPAPNVRVMLGARFAGNDKIAVRKSEDISTMPADSLDLIVMHSVAQYLGSHEFDDLAKTFRRLLKPGGLLVVGDVIPRRISALADAQALLRFGWQEGFSAAVGPVRTYFGLLAAAQTIGLSRYDADEIAASSKLRLFGAPARSNIGHNDRRITILAHAR